MNILRAPHITGTDWLMSHSQFSPQIPKKKKKKKKEKKEKHPKCGIWCVDKGVTVCLIQEGGSDLRRKEEGKWSPRTGHLALVLWLACLES